MATKCQQYMVGDGIRIYVPVYKISPWRKLGYPELPSVEETNDYIVSQIGDPIAKAVRESAEGRINSVTARSYVLEGLHAIGYWPNPRLPEGQRAKKSEAWIDGMVFTSVAAIQGFRAWR